MKPDTNVDQYLSALPAEKRASLEQLRADIRSAAPNAEECISYGVPAFKQDGGLVSFGAAKNHCSFFVQSPAVLEGFAPDLGGYSKTKGTIHFKPGETLPGELVARIVAARLAENHALRANKKTRAKAR